MNKQQATVTYFKKGKSFEITDLNIDKMINTLDDYVKNGIFKWAVMDLGFSKTGEKNKRYYELRDQLSTEFSGDPKAQTLLDKMSLVHVRHIGEISQTSRPTKEQREARKKEIEDLLIKISVAAEANGLTEEEIQKIVKNF